jgi:hypothetical protein
MSSFSMESFHAFSMCPSLLVFCFHWRHALHWARTWSVPPQTKQAPLAVEAAAFLRLFLRSSRCFRRASDSWSSGSGLPWMSECGR